MTTLAPVAATHDGYRHEAYVFHDLDQFLGDTATFVLDGLRAGQPVMVAVPPQRMGLLRLALGPDAAEVQFVDMAELGANPARIIPAWQEFIDQHGGDGQPIRGVGEPIWSGRTATELVECQVHEALLNLAVNPQTPLWLRCPYDAAALPADVIIEAHRSHPMVVEAVDGGQDAAALRGSALYGGRAHVDALFSSRLPAARGPVEALPFDAEGLPHVRETVARRAVDAGLAVDRAAELALVMHELAANSVRHGGGGGTLRIWVDDDSLVAEIQDGGQLADVMAGRRLTPAAAEGGRGLWLAHQMSDLVQIRRGPEGTTVRVLSWV